MINEHPPTWEALMCWDCVLEYGGDENTPITDDMRLLSTRIWAWFQHDDHAAGGELHVILDDMNLDDVFLNGHRWDRTPPDMRLEGDVILAALRQLPEPQRAVAVFNGYSRPDLELS